MAARATIQKVINSLKNVKNFERIGQYISVVDAKEDSWKGTMPVLQEHLDANGTLHGGCTAALIGAVSNYGFVSEPGPIIDVSVSYIGTAKLGDVLTIESSGLDTKGAIRFADVIIKNQDGKLIAKGSHTSFYRKPLKYGSKLLLSRY